MVRWSWITVKLEIQSSTVESNRWWAILKIVLLCYTRSWKCRRLSRRLDAQCTAKKTVSSCPHAPLHAVHPRIASGRTDGLWWSSGADVCGFHVSSKWRRTVYRPIGVLRCIDLDHRHRRADNVLLSTAVTISRLCVIRPSYYVSKSPCHFIHSDGEDVTTVINFCLLIVTYFAAGFCRHAHCYIPL